MTTEGLGTRATRGKAAYTVYICTKPDCGPNLRTRYSRWVCSRNLCAASKSGSFSCEATGAYAACTSERSIAASKLSASPSYAAERNTADAASPVFEMILFPSLAASASRAAVCCAWHAECHQTRDEAWHLLLEPGAQRITCLLPGQFGKVCVVELLPLFIVRPNCSRYGGECPLCRPLLLVPPRLGCAVGVACRLGSRRAAHVFAKMSTPQATPPPA